MTWQPDSTLYCIAGVNKTCNTRTCSFIFFLATFFSLLSNVRKYKKYNQIECTCDTNKTKEKTKNQNNKHNQPNRAITVCAHNSFVYFLYEPEYSSVFLWHKHQQLLLRWHTVMMINTIPHLVRVFLRTAHYYCELHNDNINLDAILLSPNISFGCLLHEQALH